MLLTAIAATVVIVSWVTGTARDRGNPGASRPHDTQLFEQPLIGLTGGVTVREITQPTPFSLVALPGPLAGTPPRVLAKPPDGSWGPWYQTEYETAAPDPKDQVGGDDVAGGGQSAGPLDGAPGPDAGVGGRITTG